MSNQLPRVDLVKISEDVHENDLNTNKGTPRGLGVLEHGIRKYGFAVPGVLDANGMIADGNKRSMIAADIGMPDDAIIIHHDGKRPIYVQLDHIDLTTPEGRAFAISLQRSQEFNEWDGDIVAQLVEMGGEELDLSWMFFDDELDKIIGANDDDWVVNLMEGEDSKSDSSKNVTMVKWEDKKIPLSDDELAWLNEVYEAYLAETGLTYGFVAHLMEAYNIAHAEE